MGGRFCPLPLKIRNEVTTFTIPNMVTIRINNQENDDIEITSIEKLSSILQPLKYYEILRTYNENAQKWAYYNAYSVDRKEVLNFASNIL